MKDKFDVIILSLAVDDFTYNTTKTCIESYINNSNDLINQIIVVESNPNFDKVYSQEKVKTIIPNKPFNYNQFYNIALEKCTSEYIIGPNNDLIIQKGCLQTILHEFQNNPLIDSISPIDRQWHRHTAMYLPSESKLYYGYEVSLHMFGCIFACRRSVFQKIGFLDESFYFFYQDNDYVMCLQRCNLLHGVHTGARVLHQSGHSNKYAEARLKYTPNNMQQQGNILNNKWNFTEPFCRGEYKPFKEYVC
jgi:glycosyltransferase involved in cell wall biosynthesis